MANEKLNGSQRVLISNLVQEFEDLKRRDNINGNFIFNAAAIKRLCGRLEKEEVISFSDAQDLEVHLFGILNLIKSTK